jgi:DNA invertase Pin-like site-specific DNA recombinase
MSEKIKSQHLGRKAVLYVRQSSAYQVNHNLESQKLQYAMQERLRQLGWREIEVIDEDLGRSAAGTVSRSGFERMVAEVCLGKVGAVAAREVSRFARNSREWQQLVEVCRVVDTVLVDQETVYAPRQSNDRLLLGLKGSLNEYELDLLRQRSLEARQEKAKRGELIVAAPVGYVKGEQRLEKDPDRRVREAIELVFSKFAELASVRQTLSWFLEHELTLPVQTQDAEPGWKSPSYGMLYNILTHPAYAGAYAYGKSEQVTHYDEGQARQAIRRKPRDRWLVLIPNAHEGYVSWEQHERIRQTISQNLFARAQAEGVQRPQGLLTGLLHCRRCGHKLLVHYTGKHHNALRYQCCRGWLDSAQPRCIGFGGQAVDQAVAGELLRVVQPAAIEAALMAAAEQAHKRDEVLAALQRDLEAACYSARRAQKQYDAADPENRLVADELERRWNQALQRVRKLEQQIEAHRQAQACTAVPAPEQLVELASDLEQVWNDPQADLRLKKRIVHSLIRDVIVDVDAQAGEVIVVIHWTGGVHTELRVPRRRRGQNATHTAKETVDAVRILARICDDRLIAGILNRNALLTGRGNRWTLERVTALRSYHEIACYQPEQRSAEGWMNLTEAARLLGVASRTLRLAAERGEIEAQHPLAVGPWVFNRSTLQTQAAAKLVERVTHTNRRRTVPAEEQAAFEFSST